MDDLTELRRMRDRAELVRNAAPDFLLALQLIRLAIRNGPRSATADIIDQIAAEAIRKATE